jgi:hypothetical protein
MSLSRTRVWYDLLMAVGVRSDWICMHSAGAGHDKMRNLLQTGHRGGDDNGDRVDSCRPRDTFERSFH